MTTLKGPVLATLANMKEHYAPGVMAYSPLTGEEYSADPGDYWHFGPEAVLRDDEGEPMILVRKVTRYEEI